MKMYTQSSACNYFIQAASRNPCERFVFFTMAMLIKVKKIANESLCDVVTDGS